MQISSVPVFQSNVGVTPSHYSFQSTQLDGMPSSYMNDQIGNMRPSWYEPFSARYINYLIYIYNMIFRLDYYAYVLILMSTFFYPLVFIQQKITAFFWI